MNKTVSSFDPATGIYTGEVQLDDSDISPMEPGVFLLPGNTVDIKCPVAPAGHQARFVQGEWVIEEISYAAVIPERPQEIPYQPIVIDPAAFLNLPLPKKATAEDEKTRLMNVVQSYMDTMAQGFGYDAAASVISYAEEPAVPRFQQEGKAFRAWRSLVWQRCYEILAEVESGTRSVPDEQQLIALLPLLEIL